MKGFFYIFTSKSTGMNIVFIEPEPRLEMYPFNLAKPNACLRIGAFTFEERWKKALPKATFSYCTEVYLSEKFPMNLLNSNVFLNPMVYTSEALVFAIEGLQEGEAMHYEGKLIAFKGSFEDFVEKRYRILSQYEKHLDFINKPWDLFEKNKEFLEQDITQLRKTREFMVIPDQVQVTGKSDKVFIEKGAQLEHCTLNTTDGSIYISENAKVLEGAMIRGTTYIAPFACVNMGSKIYGSTTIGPHCKVGGELNNVVMMQYSNKGHEGFLGNSVIGEWCNLGADTNNSNLKNTYSEVEVWSHVDQKYIDTQLQFCGLLMGDHAKSAINTQFNTGTVVGFSANIFTEGFPPKHIKSFSFGGKKNSPNIRLSSAKETARKMMERRKVDFEAKEEAIFNYLYDNF